MTRDREAELREWLNKRVKPGDADAEDALWQKLQPLVVDVLNGGEPRSSLLKQALVEINFAKKYMSGRLLAVRQQQRQRQQQQQLLYSPSTYDANSKGTVERMFWRSKVFSLSVARAATAEPPVQQFRSKTLGGHLLTSEEARDFLTSPFNRFVPWEMHDQLHDSEMVEGLRLDSYSVSSDPDDAEATRETVEREALTASRLDKPNPFEKYADFPVHSAVFSHDASNRMIEITPQFESSFLSSVAFVLPDEPRPHRVPFWTHAALDPVSRISAFLSSCYPWKLWQSTAFLLTGAVPNVYPLEVISEGWELGHNSDQPYLEISVRAPLWVSSKAVEKQFRSFQRRMLGGTNRQLNEKNLALLEYIDSALYRQSISDPECLPSWRKLMAGWNVRYPDWRYPTPGSNSSEENAPRLFARDYQRAKAVLQNPGSGVASLPLYSNNRVHFPMGYTDHPLFTDILEDNKE
jgi:hypothetical protein